MKSKCSRLHSKIIQYTKVSKQSSLKVNVRSRRRLNKDLHYEFPLSEKCNESDYHVPDEENYWLSLKESMNINYSNEELDVEIDNKIWRIIDWFKKIDNNEFVEQKDDYKKPDNYLDCFLPTPSQIEKLQDLEITLDFDVPILHQMTYKLCMEYSTRHSKKFASLNMDYKSGIFSKRESEVVLQNWIDFQQKYGVYDLRPMLSALTLKLYGTPEKLKICNFSYIDISTMFKFITLMARGLPKRSLHQVYNFMVDNIGKVRGNVLVYKKPSLSGKIVCLTKRCIERYGFQPVFIGSLLGERCIKSFELIYHCFMKFEYIPIRKGKWKLDEQLRLVKEVFSQWSSSISQCESANRPVKWENMLAAVRTRLPEHCYVHWNSFLKQLIHVEIKRKNNQIDDYTPPKWSTDDLIKLIEVVYYSNAEALAHVDFMTISKKHFPDYCDKFLMHRFSALYRCRVPRKHKFYFDDGIEYLYKEVIPLLKKKVKTINKKQRKAKKVCNPDMSQLRQDIFTLLTQTVEHD